MTKRWVAVWLMLLLAVGPTFAGEAQLPPGSVGANFQADAVATGNGAAVNTGGLSAYVLTISGITSATITFEATIKSDGSSGWTAIQGVNVTTGAVSTTATADSSWYLPVAGWSMLRARISTYVSGTINVTGRGSLASQNTVVASSSGGGGTSSVNVAQWGGVATALGQAAMASSVPVVIASNQSNVPTNTVQLGGIAINLGNGTTGTGTQRVTLASDSTGAVAATQSGTWNINNVSGTVSLPTGASTATKQPALGTAGTASADVITVQGIASMTALKTDGSATTQPVSGTVAVSNAFTLDATSAALNLAQASTTAGQTGPLIQGSVTTAAPSYTNAKTSPLSLDTFGSLRVGGTTFSTYSAASNDIALAAAATDVFTIKGSGTKTVIITRIQISGVATAAGSVSVLLIKRSTADTAGTQTAPTIVPLDSANAAGTAVANAYTANPTLGTGVGTIRTQTLSLTTAASSALAENPMICVFGNSPEQFVVLRGTAEQLCVNLNGVTVTGGVLNIDVQFEEF